jgi:GNAT superfamily N-acetyltransferase
MEFNKKGVRFMITIKEVKTRKDLNRFIEFPNELYKDNPYYIPSLYMDEWNHLKKGKNPALKYCDLVMYLAYNEKGEIVGRTAGILNHEYNKHKNVKQVRFNRIDFIDDIEVVKALLGAVENWAKENGMNEVIGPIGFTDLDKQGLLIEGFDEEDMFITLYHYPYYQKHIEALGYGKDVDWVEYEIDVSSIDDETIEKVTKLGEAVKRRNEYRLIKPCRLKLPKWGRKMFKVYNDAFQDLYGFLAIPDDVMNFYISQVILIVRREYVWFIVDKNDDVVGFALLMPSMSKVTKKHRGKLNIFNALSYLKAIQGKHDTLDMYFVAINPEDQKKGIPAIFMADALKIVKKNKVKRALTGPELENNHEVMNLWGRYPHRQHRRRRCYTKKI